LKFLYTQTDGENPEKPYKMTQRDFAINPYMEYLKRAEMVELLRIPDESGHHSGGKAATVPTGIRPAFRFDCGHHSGAIRPV